MLANVAGLSLKHFSAGYWAFAERLFSCEIDFRGRLFGFPFFLCFQLTLLESKADIFLVGQDEKCFEWPALAGNKALEQIRFAGREQFVHLLSLDRSLQDDFARTEITRFIRADGIFADIAHSRFENAPAAFRTCAQCLL